MFVLGSTPSSVFAFARQRVEVDAATVVKSEQQEESQ
jgi:hypothetical protein